jgi:hypothetical protein
MANQVKFGTEIEICCHGTCMNITDAWVVALPLGAQLYVCQACGWSCGDEERPRLSPEQVKLTMAQWVQTYLLTDNDDVSAELPRTRQDLARDFVRFLEVTQIDI